MNEIQTPIYLAALYEKTKSAAPVFLSQFYDAQKVPFPIRSKSAQICKFTAREVTIALEQQKIISARYQSAENLIVHGYKWGNYSAICVVSEKVAQSRVIRCFEQMLEKIAQEQLQSDVDCEIADCQEYIGLFEEEEKLEELENELNETKNLVYENLEQVISRGQNLDEIYAEAVDLTDDAKTFLKATKKLKCRCWGM